MSWPAFDSVRKRWARLACIVLVGMLTGAPIALAKSKRASTPRQSTRADEVASNAAAPLGDVAFAFIRGQGLMRLRDGSAELVMPTQAAIRDLVLDAEGAVWASLRDTGVLRLRGDKKTTVSKDSFERLAVRSPTDVWAVNDGHGSVVHFDGAGWKTVRTRNSLTGAFADNRLIDITAEAGRVWVASWNGLWSVTGGRWTHVPPPASAVTEGEPAFPLSLLATRRGLVACYFSGCFLSDASGWQDAHWPVDKARLRAAGGSSLMAGIAADGRSVLVSDAVGSHPPATSAPLAPDGINDLFVDARGRIWVATGAQLVVLDDRAQLLERWQPTVTESEPIAVDRIAVVGNGPSRLPSK
jgi:ligand-binding sensor domain-containing protein